MNTWNDLHWMSVDVRPSLETGGRMILRSALVLREGQEALRLWEECHYAKDLPIWHEDNRLVHAAYWHGERELRLGACRSLEQLREKLETETVPQP